MNSTAADNCDSATPRVAYLLRMYPRFSQTFIVNEILELERTGWDLSIGSLRTPSENVEHDSVQRVRADVEVCEDAAPFETRPEDQETVRALAAEWNIAEEEQTQALWTLDWARRRGIDHAHVHFGTGEATAAWLARQAGGPTYSLTLHAFDIFRENVDRPLLAQKINGSSFTVTVCESNREFLEANMPGVIPERIRVNYNGIDLSRFSAPQGKRDPALVFSVGRMIEKKGFIHLIRAAALLRDEGVPLRVEIAGDGREKKRLLSEIERLELSQHVHLLGPISQEQVQQRLRNAACFVLPCVCAADGNVDALPTVLLESLASGCPSISTRISGVPEIIEEGVSGLLAEPGDEAALAKAIARVLLSPSLAAQLGRQGRVRAEQRFDVQTNVDVFASWLRRRNADRTPLAEAS